MMEEILVKAVGLEGLAALALLLVLILIKYLAKIVYIRNALRLAPLLDGIRQYAELNIDRSLSRRLKQLRYGPDWDAFKQSVESSAYFIEESPIMERGDEPTQKPLFHIHDDPRTVYSKRSPPPKLHLFFCQGIRSKIPWIDFMYMRMLNELREQGARILVLLHNDDFDPIDADGRKRPTHPDSKSPGFVKMKDNLEKLFGISFAKHVHFGREYLTKNRGLMRRYIQFIYDDVASLYASDRAEHELSDPVPTAKEFVNTIDGFACSSLLSKGFVLYVGWERQTFKWTSGGLKNVSAALANGFVIGNTIKNKSDHRVNVYSPENVLNLFDTDTEMATKLFGEDPSVGDSDFFTDLTTVRNICIGPARLGISEWNYQTIEKQTAPGELNLKFAAYMEILRPHYAVVSNALKHFLDFKIPLARLDDNNLKNEVCARCAAYSNIRRIRDS